MIHLIFMGQEEQRMFDQNKSTRIFPPDSSFSDI